MTTVDRPMPLLGPRSHGMTDWWQGVAFNRLTTIFERATEVPFDDASRLLSQSIRYHAAPMVETIV